MSKFENWMDLHKFHKEVHEDDWNDGQYLVVKDKRNAGPHKFATTIKVAEEKAGSHVVAVEEKINVVIKEFGGQDIEAKFKSAGSLDYEHKLHFLKVSLNSNFPSLSWNEFNEFYRKIC